MDRNDILKSALAKLKSRAQQIGNKQVNAPKFMTGLQDTGYAVNELVKSTPFGTKIADRLNVNLPQTPATDVGRGMGIATGAVPLMAMTGGIGNAIKGVRGIKAIQSPLLKQGARLAGPLTSTGRASTIVGKGLTNVAQGIPYTAGYQAYNQLMGSEKQNSAKELGTDLAFDFATGSIPLLGVAGTIGGKTAQSFIGKSGDDLAEQIMKKGGYSDVMDKQFRFPISDFYSKINRKVFERLTKQIDKTGEVAETTLGEFLKHDELYKEYPQLKGVKVIFDPKIDVRGNFNPSNGVITLNPKEGSFPEKLGVLLHENQHLLQTVENFSKGDNPLDFTQQSEAVLARDALIFRRELEKLPKGLDISAKHNMVVEEYSRLGMMDWLPSREAREIAMDNSQPTKDLEELIKLYRLDKSATPATPFNLYKNTKGEIEARAVQNPASIGLTQKELQGRDILAEQMKRDNIRPDEVIVRNGAGGMADTAEDELVKEARKYKSAKEFVKAQRANPQIVWHETDAENVPNILSEGFKTGKELKTGELVDSVHFTASKNKTGTSYVRGTGRGDRVAVDTSNLKLLDIDSLDDLKGKPSFEQPKYVVRKNAENGVFPEGYDGLVWRNKDGSIHEVILPKEVANKNIIGTKSQLTDIWNKANSVMSDAGIQEIQDIIDGKKVLTVEDFVREAENLKFNKPVAKEMIDDIKQTQSVLGQKVNILDYLRTPDRVLKKIGLGKEAELVKQKYNDYLDDLPKEINKINQWYDAVGRDKGTSQRIFQYLDGNKQPNLLSDSELKIANEIKAYLAEWADKLRLPADSRIANYITHIFEQDFIQKEFDPDLAKILQDKVPGSVYDPFLEKRLGKQGYVEDVFRALDAYVKRATRKYHMDQALEPLKDSAEKLPLESWNYVKSFADRVNMRPTDIDNLFDNFIKQLPGVGYQFGQRPTANLSRKVRQAVYRGTLGLNVSSAIRNLTQGANTYSELGEKWTAWGYVKALQEMASRGDELQRVGVLRDNIIQDRTLSAVQKRMEKFDKKLFFLFDLAEKVNRGSAYFGAKARALSKGKSEQEAIKEAVELVRKTQFTFGSVDTPVALQSDLAKLITQFQSFNLKQAEFLGEKIKDKDVLGLIRWVAATLAMTYGIKEALGINMEFSDAIPFSDLASGEGKIGQTPPFQLAKGVGQAVFKTPDNFGNVPEGNVFQRIAANKDVQSAGVAFVPAGIQAKKTITGLRDTAQGYNTSKSGLIRWPVSRDKGTQVRNILFGPYANEDARNYFDNELTPLGEKQTERFKTAPNPREYYDSVMEKRQVDREKRKMLETNDTEGLRKTSALEASTVELPTEQTQFNRVYKDATKTLEKKKLELEDLPYENLDQFDTDEKRLKIEEAIAYNQTLVDRMQQERPELVQQAEYLDIASESLDIRTIHVKEQLADATDKQSAIYKLAEMRRTVNGKAILTNPVIDALVKDELISKDEGAMLKRLSITDENGKPVVKMTGRGKSAKVKKISQVKAPKTPQIRVSDRKFGITPPTTNVKVKEIKTKGITPIKSELPKFKVKFKL